MKTVKLKQPFDGPRGKITEIRFRAPKFADFFDLGDPRMPVAVGDSFYWQELQDVYLKYIERLAVDIDINLLAMLGLADSLEIRKTIRGFFTEAEDRPQDGTTDTSGTPSGDLPTSSFSSESKTSDLSTI